MSAYMKRIEVQSNYGSIIAYVDQDSVQHPQSDSEDSTEPVVMNRKPMREANISMPVPTLQTYCDYDMWGECDDELEASSSKPIKETCFSPAMEEDVWWQMNKDFARDAKDIEVIKPVMKTHPAVPSDVAYADYDMWGECDDEMEVVNSKPMQEARSVGDDVWWQMNKDFALDGQDDEFYIPNKKYVVKQDVVRVSSRTPALNEVEWREINKDFARDNARMEILPTDSSLVDSYGDYDIWGESE